MFRAAYGRGAHSCVYYQCPHNANNPRYAADHSGHPRTVKIREDLLDQVVAAFFRDRLFGPGRAALLTATDAAAAADRDTQTAAPTARLRQLDTGMGSCVLELEQLSADPADTATPAGSAPGSPNQTSVIFLAEIPRLVLINKDFDFCFRSDYSARQRHAAG
jgi:hypothetical protein